MCVGLLESHLQSTTLLFATISKSIRMGIHLTFQFLNSDIIAEGNVIKLIGRQLLIIRADTNAGLREANTTAGCWIIRTFKSLRAWLGFINIRRFPNEDFPAGSTQSNANKPLELAQKNHFGGSQNLQLNSSSIRFRPMSAANRLDKILISLKWRDSEDLLIDRRACFQFQYKWALSKRTHYEFFNSRDRPILSCLFQSHTFCNQRLIWFRREIIGWYDEFVATLTQMRLNSNSADNAVPHCLLLKVTSNGRECQQVDIIY